MVSYYHDGVQIYDISNPAAPTKVAYYDTETTNTSYNGFVGSWGAYPYLPSGNVLVSDINNGLFVLKPAFDLQDTACPASLAIDEVIISDGVYSAEEFITAKGVVPLNADVSFKAGNRITLEPGFDSKSGSNFDAFIEACAAADLQEETPTAIFTKPTEIELLAAEKNLMPSTTLTVRPNPFTTTTTIQIEVPTTKDLSLYLLDGQGRVLSQLLAPQFKESGTYQIRQDFAFLEKGIYFLQMQTDKEVITKKIIK